MNDKAKQLAWLRRIAADLQTAILRELEDELPWYRTMPPTRKSAVANVAQQGVTSFIEWCEDPGAQPWIAADVFAAAPRELLRSVSLQQTLQIIRSVVNVFERIIGGQDERMLEPILRYSRDIAFAAADVYARAAESRGLWDARLEALVVDSILTGEHDDELPSRSAALGWNADGECAVIVGAAPVNVDIDLLRRSARRAGADVLIGQHSSRLIVVATGRVQEDGTPQEIDFGEIADVLDESFGEGAVVHGPPASSVQNASKSAKAALAGLAVSRAWRQAPRPVGADQLLPERALAGDPLAKGTLVRSIYRPLQDHSSDLTTTLWAYLDNGRSLEATARELSVHPNTVRYRLKRVGDVIGLDATNARQSHILHTALILGAMQGERRR
ncbi:MAG TPA: helix-turn-helix domain-containing protein [Candidatus Agrococcus pullicola]|uniref:Helix-turn-helix domain-containing protein n=1 Tax=Candidatus Agrococcus pullicola TaxID=2838429 RepID=A0A9D1YY31_9MICO|nr:helix-turn-helix domain-containing protein [Candidatus Agrococcus pullicola]